MRCHYGGFRRVQILNPLLARLRDPRSFQFRSGLGRDSCEGYANEALQYKVFFVRSFTMGVVRFLIDCRDTAVKISTSYEIYELWST